MTTLKEYRDEMNRVFARNIRHGFVDYWHCGRLGAEIMELMDNATEEFSSRGEYKELFDLTNKAFLKWGKTDKDDSSGETQSFMYDVNDAWNRVYEAEDPRIPHSKMYSWFEGHIDGSVIDYMEEYLYEYLMKHFYEPELLEKKFAFLNEKIEESRRSDNEFDREYQVRSCQQYLLSLMADMGKPIEEIRNFEAEIQTISSKEILAEIEERYGNKDEMIALYRELAAEEDRRGWPRENWHIKLKEIYKEMDDKENYLLELLSAMAMNLGNEDLWMEYKGCFPPENWPIVREQVFSLVESGKYRLIPWYALEERYDLVMDEIEDGLHTDWLKKYKKELQSRYPERCVKVLSDETKEMAERSNNRKDYRKVAKNLRWMQQFPGGWEATAELAEEFRVQYKRRPAMIEEIAEF